MSDEEICPLSGNPCSKHKCHDMTIHGVCGKMTSLACEDCIINISELKTMESPQNPKNIFELLFGGVKNYVADMIKKKQEQLAIIEKKSIEVGPCPICGMSLLDIAKIGRMGCPTCYDKFGDEIRKVLLDVRNNTNQHQEKDTKNSSEVESKSSISENNSILKIKSYLNAELASCIKTEDYETATILRDLLKFLNSKINPS